MDTAKVFMTGRSQAVRLPKAYRFDTSEVLIEKMADGSVVLRPKVLKGLGTRLWEALGEEPMGNFERPPQGKLERDGAWWDSNGFVDAQPVSEPLLVREPDPTPLDGSKPVVARQGRKPR